MSVTKDILAAALEYREAMDCSIIPIRGTHYAQGDTDEDKEDSSKQPLISWKRFQGEKPTEKEIKDWYKKWPHMNVAIVTGAISDLAIIDVDEPAAAKPVLNELVPDSILYPISQTPSGGEHWFFRYADTNLRNNTKVIPGADLRAEGGYVIVPPSVGFNGIPYTWRAGLEIAQITPPPLPPAYINYLINIAFKGGGVTGGFSTCGFSFEQGTRDNTLFHIANCLAKGGMPDNEILQTLERVALACNPPFPLNELQTKVISAIKRKAHREMNVSEEVRRYIQLTDGYFSVKSCYEQLKALNIVKDVKNSEKLRVTIRQVLFNLKKDGVIEPDGKRDGFYRRVDDKAEEIDWSIADSDPVPLQLPLGISKYCEVYPGNIIVNAGESNAGKTALTLNTAKDNADRFEIDYFSSEMGPTELKKRLSKFEGVSIETWRKIRFMERTSNFADVLNGDRLTIIDFLEVVSDFYQIAALLFDIHKKMGMGICIVNIQKNKGTDFGRGGQLGLEKPRLYLSMEQNRLKIIKAKAWAQDGVNPNGLQRDFKLVQGSKFIATTPWDKP